MLDQKVIDPNQTSYLRDEVKAFAQLMEFRLRANDYKGGWENTDPIYLLRLLKVVENKLEHELIHGVPKIDCWDTLYIAADLANYSMMIADNMRRLFHDEGIRSIPNKAGE